MTKLNEEYQTKEPRQSETRRKKQNSEAGENMSPEQEKLYDFFRKSSHYFQESSPLPESRKKDLGGIQEKISIDLLSHFLEYFCFEQKIPLRKLLLTVEKNILLRVLSRCNGNQKEAAKILGMNYTTLNEKIKRYGIRFQRRPIRDTI